MRGDIGKVGAREQLRKFRKVVFFPKVGLYLFRFEG